MIRLRENPRFDVVAHALLAARTGRLRLKTGVDDGESVASLVPIWNGANWLEREAYDMFGIVFDGHPNLRRMLLPDDWHEGTRCARTTRCAAGSEFPVYNTDRYCRPRPHPLEGRGAA